MSELSKMKLCSPIISMSRILFGRESTKKFMLAIEVNRTFPFLVNLIPTNAFVSTGVGFASYLVCLVLLGRTFSEIFLPIIQCVMIFMVAFFFVATAKDKSMKHNGLRTFTFHGIIPTSSSIKSFGFRAEMGIPIPLQKPLKIFSIDNGIFVLGKWNQAVRCVKRLSDCVTFHAEFFTHRLTSSKMVQLSRYYITGGPCQGH